MISSGAAFLIYAGWSAYAAGKASLDQWVRTVAAEQELQHRSVRVLSIAPGILDTEMQAIARAQQAGHYPWVAEFRELKARGALRSPDTAAREIWDILEGDVANGSVLDLHKPAS